MGLDLIWTKAILLTGVVLEFSVGGVLFENGVQIINFDTVSEVKLIDKNQCIMFK